MGSRLKNRNKVISFFGDVFSLDFKYRAYIFILILFFLALIPIEVLENSPRITICNYIPDNICYSQGLTRGVSSLLKLDFTQALEYNKLSLPVLIILIGFIFVDIKRKISEK